ncbi:Uma2 family endonuclease [Streptomyces sp. I05A-00742]|uniref:Uma2 family endonuclease n=1 Tax=Streptomyces sp. I05A-00742 TaxID=2732853 RepID=UPI0014882AAF|nr:Uma2 family endonuclease [Streptomyces sp. I05A-00742]
MTADRLEKATPENWMFPPADGWVYAQVKDLDLPFDWELVDGVIVVRGQTKLWHDIVRDELRFHLRQASPEEYRVNVERCVMLEDKTVIKPDVVVCDRKELDLLGVECTSVDKVKLAVEVVSPGSRSDDGFRKPAQFAQAGVPFFWRVELEGQGLAVHEYWLPGGGHSYVAAPLHPVHREKLMTELPFPVEIDLTGLLE